MQWDDSSKSGFTTSKYTWNMLNTNYKEYNVKKLDKDPHIRLKFRDSGIDITVRYKSLARKRNQITTDITREILIPFKEQALKYKSSCLHLIYRNESSLLQE